MITAKIIQPTDHELGAYFEWLCGQVSSEGLDHGYVGLLSYLHDFPFVYRISMDENRASDGLALRKDYGIYWFAAPSVLEVLVALAKRMTYIQGMDDGYWFWEMIQNLDLEDFDDEYFSDWSEDIAKGTWPIDQIIDRWLGRRFGYTGHGSPFPLKQAKENQRKIELWYQMQTYLAEKYDIT